ncbi:MAG: hypothetical protein H6510_08160 [Acidobacteria bacterium]|nr:hypothetical protein [Acidobacteriota bacterium]MCB9397773.1 hypothetical protein [Acidobacteriota bacterium]
MDQRDRLAQIKEAVGVSPEELSVYRRNLFSAPKRRAFFGWSWLVACALLLATLLGYRLLMPGAPVFPSLDSLEARVQPPDTQKQLLKWAHQSLSKGQPWSADRAHLVFALYGPPEVAVEHAIQALNLTHDDDARILCLEVLVDYGEQFYFQPEWVEQQLDRETHPTCRHLWNALLRLNQS